VFISVYLFIIPEVTKINTPQKTHEINIVMINIFTTLKCRILFHAMPRFLRSSLIKDASIMIETRINIVCNMAGLFIFIPFGCLPAMLCGGSTVWAPAFSDFFVM